MRAHVTGSCTSFRRLMGGTSLHLRSTPAGLRRRCAAQADTPSIHLTSGVYGETEQAMRWARVLLGCRCC